MSAELPKSWTARFESSRAQTLARHRLRTARAISHRDGVRCVVDGREVVNFCGNDYLGLGARQSAVPLDGAGSAHMVSGHFAEHDALVAELCDWLSADDALLCGNGFVGNLAALSTLCGDGDLCVQDRLNHASMLDAARGSGALLARYPHNDVEGARQQLMRSVSGASLLATDSVFSMDGDIAPLSALRSLCDELGALFYVDEAHSIGVLGSQGAGLAADADLRLVTFGKALGSYGAALVGKRSVIDYLRQNARPLLFTTALPPSIAQHVLLNIREIRQGELLARLDHNREVLRTSEASLAGGESAIFTLNLGSEQRALDASQSLLEQGYWVSAIRPPTVPEGSSRLRVTLSALHDEAQIAGLAKALMSL